ncbi:substrate-binding domain-containing protein [Microbacterium gorillae]|uniref:substrate-binding domain-containing protein n=1 Tax=Microbacterium gorillae TaxID=1231063 RepID=UPI000590E250|nr:substrate-binding domain-containing protein [Microbacterium gorillae]
MRGISSMATRHVLGDLADASVAAGLPSVDIESVGGVTAEERVSGGEPFDLVLLASGALKRLADAGHIDPATVTPLVLSPVAVAVPSGTDEPAAAPDGPAFPDAAALRDALRATERIGYSTGPSGTALVRMVEDWGLTAEIGDRLVQARAGVPVAASLASGDVDLGFQQLSELVGQPGVRILGVMPADCAIDTVFSGAVAATSARPADAAAVLAYFASAAASAIKIAHHFTAV